MRKKILSVLLCITMLGSLCTSLAVTAAAEGAVQYKQTKRMMEELNRGLIAVKVSGGVYLSWRVLGKEDLATTAYNVYKEGISTPIATIAGGEASNYIDKTGTAGNKYKVVVSTATAAQIDEEPWTQATETNGDDTYTYMDIPISKPTDIPHANTTAMSDYNRSSGIGGANDVSLGDLDGDGDYEVVLKWDPKDSKDSSSGKTTGHCVYDAYEISPSNDGFMWRIDIGNNIAAGAHYSQFMVYDFDNNGKAEIATITAPGSYSLVKNGEGGYDKIYVTTVGDTEEIQKADNNATTLRKGNNNGPEYYTIFDGETGRPLKTTAAIPLGKEDGSEWGDAKMNRSSRYLAAVAYLDGVNPYYVPVRGMYNRTVLRAYTWDGENLTLVKEHDGRTKGTSLYGEGNHNLSVADIDNDGKDEIVYGSASLDDDFTTSLGNTKMGHGDAMHVSDFNNDGKIEVFSVKEDSEGFKRGMDFRNALTGNAIWSKSVTTDNGRGVMDNIDDAYAKTHPDALALGWDAAHDKTYDLKGNEVNAKPSGNSRSFCNFLVYWDDDLGRELLDGNQMAKYNAETGETARIFFNKQGYLPGEANNSTKQNPSLVADLWGDWREEIIMPANDDTVLRVMTPITPTKYRLTTLMHDSQYRESIAWQNVGYNQPPHTSYYIGSAALAKDSEGNTLNYLNPTTPFDQIMYPSDIPDVPITGIEMTHDGTGLPATIELERTKTYQIDAAVVPSEARKKGIRWTSSDPTLATVNGGLIKAVGGEGNVTITATAVGNDQISKSVTVHVFSTPVESVSITDPSEIVQSLTPGDSRTFTAQVTPGNASEKTVEWRSSNPTVATVDNTGKVTAVSMGLATIYAKTVDGDFEDARVINVLPPAVEDASGSGEFVLDTTDCGTFNGTATGANLVQDNSANEAIFHRTVETVDSDKANLSFRFTTGGTKVNGSDWNWKNHEFSLYVKLLGDGGENMLTFHQPFNLVSGDTVKAGTLTTQTNSDSSAQGFPTGWTAIVDGSGDISGSAKRWQVDVEFDYVNNTANAVIYGFGNGFSSEPTTSYKRTFNLPAGKKFGKLEISSVKETGCQGIYWTPVVENFSYEKVVPSQDGAASVLYRRGERMGIPWSESDIAAATGGFTPTNQATYPLMYDAENKRIWFNPTKPAASYSASKEFAIEDDALVEYDLDWYFGSAVGADREHSEYIQIGDKIRFGWKKDYNVYLSKDAGATWDKSVFVGSNTTFTKNIHLTYDKATKTIKSLTFGGTTVIANETLDDPMNKVTFGLNRIDGSSTSDWGYPCGLDNIAVSQFVPGAETKFKATFANIDGTVIDEQDIKVGEKATKPVTDPTKAADEKYDTYVFKNWSPDPETTNIIDDTVFTAQYNVSNPKTYTVTLNTHNGVIAEGADVTSYTYSDTTSVPLPTPTRTGFTFHGWFETETSTVTEPVGTGVDDYVEEEEVFKEIAAGTTGNIVLHARWSPEEYALTLNTDGGTITSGEITSYSYGMGVTLPTAITKKGSSFAGWYDNADFTGDPVTVVPADAMGAKTYYAKWDEATYNVNIHLFGGTLDPMVTSYKYGDAITLATPTKPGFTFGGWYSNSSYRTTSSKINATDTGDKNFYAKWTSSAPTIEFGSVGEDGKTVNAYFSSSKETDVIIGVLYDGTAVKEIKTAVATATNWAANTVYAKDIKFDNNVNNYDLKLFLWDGIGTAKPLAATPGIHKKAAN